MTYFESLKYNKSLFRYKTRNDSEYAKINNVEKVKLLSANCASIIAYMKRNRTFEREDSAIVEEIIGKFELGLSKIINMNTSFTRNLDFQISEEDMDILLNDLNIYHMELDEMNNKRMMRD